MRLALTTRIVLWIAQREREEIVTTREHIYNYWIHMKGVTREDVTNCLDSLIFQTLVQDPETKTDQFHPGVAKGTLCKCGATVEQHKTWEGEEVVMFPKNDIEDACRGFQWSISSK